LFTVVHYESSPGTRQLRQPIYAITYRLSMPRLIPF
jgi:hypothetical protein